ncbi:hypothetical protein Vadar_025856 [Vaccinium darrowii]|uniref:Uncharacterized protein n=1 Tax=Vaccinium darrowii TaxID=229202 RepID=A0ACB7Y8Y8_9ERIC|nr:hypothetical protein Vadar_025856 [Vaccinium darrowii]
MINLNQFLIRSYTNSRSTTQSHSLVKKTQRQKNPNLELLNQENPKRFFCTSDSSKEEKPTSPSPYPCQNPEFKEGPTVERDPSAIDKDARDVLQSMMKNICSLSKALAILGLVHLGLGAWISYITNSSPFTLSTEVSILGFLFFGFPFAVAFGLRQLLKHFVYVFNVMEELGSFQIPTPTLQKAKNLNLHLVRLRGFSYLCIGGASIVMVCNALARLT